MKSVILSGIILLSVFSSANYAQSKKSVTTRVEKHHSQLININKASVKELSGVYKGIGQRRAEAIVDYRSQHGNFNSLSDLAKVKKVGETFVKRNLSELDKILTVSD